MQKYDTKDKAVLCLVGRKKSISLDCKMIRHHTVSMQKESRHSQPILTQAEQEYILHLRSRTQDPNTRNEVLDEAVLFHLATAGPDGPVSDHLNAVVKYYRRMTGCWANLESMLNASSERLRPVLHRLVGEQG